MFREGKRGVFKLHDITYMIVIQLSFILNDNRT